MRIGVNTRFLIKDKLEGLGRYSHEVISRMVKDHPEHEFVFFFDRDYSEEFIYADNVTPVKVFPPARHPFLWYLWFEWALPRAIKKYKIDYFFSPDSFLMGQSSVKQHLVVHDLAFEHVENGVGGLVQKYYKRFLPKYCKSAERIVTVSHFTKQDVVNQYGISPEIIDVAHNGASSTFAPVSESSKTEIKSKFTHGAEYFVFVGAMHPRKNISRLLQAFDQFKSQNESDFKLVLVGRKAWQNEEMEMVYEQMNHKQDVVFTGRLSDDDLASVIGSAYAMAYVPLFEGFGLPILESNQCGVPVICSNTSSMPEVGGDACVLVDPYSVQSISEGMNCIIQEDKYKEIKSKCKLNAERFSWDTTAQLVWESMMKGVGNANI